MSNRGNHNGKLSENDKLIKSLRDKQKNINNRNLKKSIAEKLDILEDGKTVEK